MENSQKKYKRIKLRRGHAIVLSIKDIQIIDKIQEVLNENQPKIALCELHNKVQEKLGVGKGWGIREKLKYCLMILYLKKKISINNCIASKQKRFRTWIWLPKNSRYLNLKKDHGMW